jgi:hypothetical protein
MRCSTATYARFAGLLCWVAAACGPEGGETFDAAVSADRPALGGAGGSGSSSRGGAGGAGGGGQTTQSGGGGGVAGGSGGAGGAGGAAGQGGSGKLDGAAGAGGRDAARSADAPAAGGTSGIDAGPLACDDITSSGRLAVYYYSSSEAQGSSIQMNFDVVNFTAFSARLSQVTIRYWFTDEEPTSPNQLEQYYVPIPTSMKFVKLDPPREGADTVLEIAFTASGDAGASFVETRGFNFAFHKASYAGTYDQTNDYSYDPKLKTALGQNPRITAYVAGQLAWGCEPPVLVTQPIDGGASIDAGLVDTATVDAETIDAGP